MKDQNSTVLLVVFKNNPVNIAQLSNNIVHCF